MQNRNFSFAELLVKQRWIIPCFVFAVLFNDLLAQNAQALRFFNPLVGIPSKTNSL
jgi:hypothetical protein